MSRKISAHSRQPTSPHAPHALHAPLLRTAHFRSLAAAMSLDSSSKGASFSSALKFDGTHWAIWKCKMLAWADMNGCADVLETDAGVDAQDGKQAASSSGGADTKAAVDAAAQAARSERSKKMYGTLLMAVAGSTALGELLLHVPRGDARAAWNALESRFERKTTANKAAVVGALLASRMSESESVDSFVSRIRSGAMSSRTWATSRARACACTC